MRHILRFRLRELDGRERRRTGFGLRLRIDCPCCEHDPFMTEYGPREYLANSLPELRKRLREDREVIATVLTG